MSKINTIKLFKLRKKQIDLYNSFIKSLKKDNSDYNLVGGSTIENFWDRHICDSLQLKTFIKDKKSTILDMGSGAGLPGIVLSIFGYKNITMVESRTKKADFIRKIIKKLNLDARVINSRIEELNIKNFQYITARALAPLDKLLNYSLFFSNQSTTLLFLKGRSVKKEIISAKKIFNFKYELHKSKSLGDGFVIKIKQFKKND